MDLFDKVASNLRTAGKDVSKKAKDVSGLAKLKFDLVDKQDQLKAYYQQLGKQYYEEQKEEKGDDFLFDQIKESLAQITEIEARILELRQVRLCPKCHKEISQSFEFCSYCGEKLTIFDEE